MPCGRRTFQRRSLWSTEECVVLLSPLFSGQKTGWFFNRLGDVSNIKRI